MLRKIFFHQTVINTFFRKSLFKCALPLSLTQSMNVKTMQHRLCCSFASGKKNHTIETALAQINQRFNTYGWSNQFTEFSLDKFSLYQDLQQYSILLELIQFYLQKAKIYVDSTHPEYITRMCQGILYATQTGDQLKAKKWLSTLYEILQNNPQLGKKIYPNTHLEFEIAQILWAVNQKPQAKKWLQLLKNKYQQFDQASQISADTRFYCYLQLTEYYELEGKPEKALECSQKAFRIVQKGSEIIKEHGQIAAIYNYIVACYKKGQKLKSYSAFDLLEQRINWDDLNCLELILRMGSSFSVDVQIAKKNAILLDKVEKVCIQRMNIADYAHVYRKRLFPRVVTSLKLQDYDKLYQATSEILGEYIDMENSQWGIQYIFFMALSQYKLGKKQEALDSLKRCLREAKRLSKVSMKFDLNKFLSDVNLAEELMGIGLEQEYKKLLSQIKQAMRMLIKSS